MIVDELSMVDVLLFSALLDALPLHCRLILVGDVDQLPPVGAGNVLSDLIAGGLIDVISLDKVFRQAQKSRIVTNAHRVVAGKMPELDCNTPDSDFFFLNTASVYAVSSQGGGAGDPANSCRLRNGQHKGYSGAVPLSQRGCRYRIPKCPIAGGVEPAGQA